MGVAIQVDQTDLKAIRSRLGAVQKKGLNKALGQANRRVGAAVIRLLHPPQVGAGRGAKVRPSATARDVLLRVGGPFREGDERLQWGQRQEWPGGEAPERPYIVATAESHQKAIIDIYRDEIHQTLRDYFGG